MTKPTYGLGIDWINSGEIKSFYDEVWRDQPEHWWRFEETSGTTAADSMNGRHGTHVSGPLVNQAAFGPGQGKAVYYDGTNDYTSIPHNADMIYLGDMSVEAWVLIPALGTPASNHEIFSKTNTPTQIAYPWRLLVDLSGNVLATFGNGTVHSVYTSTSPITATNWHQIGFSLSGTSLTIYIDGVAAGTFTMLDARLDSGNITTIGATRVPNVFTAGYIDEVQIYRYALGADRFDAHYRAGRDHWTQQIAQDRPQAWWRMDAAVGATSQPSAVAGATGSVALTASGGVTFGVPGAIYGDTNAAARFDGVNDRMVAASSYKVPNGSYTIECWVKATPGVTNRGICGSWDGAGAMLWIDGSGYYAVAHAGGPHLTTGYQPTGNWDHLLTTYDGTWSRIYIGSVLYAQQAEAAPGSSTSFFEVGSYSGGAGGTFLTGSVDEVAVYDHVLDQGRIGEHWFAGVISGRKWADTDVLYDFGVTANVGRNSLSAQSPPIANDLRFSLRNTSGIYSPSRIGMPLEGMVKTGRDVRFFCVDTGGSGYTFEIMGGKLVEILPHPDLYTQSVEFVAFSNLSQLVGATGFSTRLYGDGTPDGSISTGTALHLIFDAAQIPLNKRRFADGAGRLRYFQIKPNDELLALAVMVWATEGASSRLFDGPDGISYFYDRFYYLSAPRSTTVQSTFRDTDNGSDPWFISPWVSDEGDKDVINHANVSLRMRVREPAFHAIWTLGAQISLAPGEVKLFQIAPSTGDPIDSVDTFTAGLDYQLTFGSLASAVYDRTSGPYVTLTLTAGGSGATLIGPAGFEADGFQVRGRLAVVDASYEVQSTVDAASSISTYRVKTLTLPVSPDIGYWEAVDLASAFVYQNMVARSTCVIEIPLATNQNNYWALALEIGDRIRVINSREGWDHEVWVETIKHIIPPGGTPRVLIGCKAALPAATDYAQWGTAQWGSSRWAW